MPRAKTPLDELLLSVVLNIVLTLLTVYIIWLYYGWSAAYSSTYQTVQADRAAAQRLVDQGRNDSTTAAYSVCLSYGWLMLSRPLNDAYAYTNFWIQYGLNRYVSPNISLWGYNNWAKALV